MRFLLFLILCAAPGFAATCGKTGTITFASVTTATKTNFTYGFSFSNTSLKTTGNGGLVASTSTRVGLTVPNDVWFTSDATGHTLTGSYTWGYSDYDATAGTGLGWIRVPTSTVGTPVVVTACIGVSGITTYQGGAQGAEFDTNTVAAFHFSNVAGVLNAKDFSSNSFDCSGTMTVVAVGKVGVAVSFNGSTGVLSCAATSSYHPSSNGPITVTTWINSATQFSITNEDVMHIDPAWYIAGLNSGTSTYVVTNNAQIYKVSDGVPRDAWVFFANSYNGSNINATLQGPITVSTVLSAAILPAGNATLMSLGTNFIGSIDEVWIAGVARTADWINDMFTNQNVLPALTLASAAQGFPVVY